MEHPPSERTRDLTERAGRLRLDAATADVFTRFDAAHIGARLLKGPSISQWLYAGRSPRPYIDCDVLVAPQDIATAEEVLHVAGYRRHFDDRTMPTWWREHAGAWLREGDDVTVDLHHTLVGIGVDDARAWQCLSAEPSSVRVHGRDIPTLALPARTLHIVLHAAQHGGGSGQALEDLRRALTVNEEIWLAAAALAADLRAVGAFAAGLALLPDGARLAARLGVPRTTSVDAELRATAAPPLALGFEQIANAPGVRAKLHILWRKAVPPAEFIRHWDPRAARGRFALARGYGLRQVWLLRRARGGFEAWRQARRSVRDK